MTIETVTTEKEHEPKEYLVPAVLVGIGVLIYLVYGLITGGVHGLATMAVYVPIRVGVQVLLGVIACFVAARLLGTTFGYLRSAIVKLAAIFVFPAAITVFIPWIGGLLALLLYWGLLEWLFELDSVETIEFAVIIWCVNAGAFFLVTAVGVAMH